MQDKYGIPSILSLVCPGMGQLVKNHHYKAYVIWLLAMPGIYFMFVYGYPFIVNFVAAFIVYSWNVHDAYNSDTDFFPKK